MRQTIDQPRSGKRGDLTGGYDPPTPKRRGRPPTGQPRRRSITVKLPVAMVEAIDHAAEASGVTRTNVIESALAVIDQSPKS